MSQTEKWFNWILKGGLLLTPFLVFVVTRSLYFPFITGKNFAFRILIEILGALWVFAALKFPSFRPRSSALAWAVVIFVAVLGIATMLSISPYRSFWSNFERMEGYIGILHLFLYFLMLGSVFRTTRDWMLFLHTSIGASVIVSLYGVFQLLGKLDIHQGGTRVDATFGNATYLGVYLLFHLLFIVLCFLRSSSRTLRAAYGAAFALEAFILYFTASRGPILGFFVGVGILTAVLSAIGFSARPRVRIIIGAILALIILVPTGFSLIRNTAPIQRSDVLVRFAHMTDDVAVKGRLIIWNMALQGWRERPFFGWGQDSFLYVFSKNYNPELWRNEPWFDRAHNVFLDWLVAGGAFGLASYLAIYGAALWLIIRGYRRGSLDLPITAGFVAILGAHFFQNLFVFDNLTSYLFFFAVIAAIHSLSTTNPMEQQESAKKPLVIPAGAQAAAAVLLAGTAAFLVYSANVKPIGVAKKILSTLVLTQQAEAAGKVDALMAGFQSAVTENTFGTMEVREQMSQVATAVVRDQAIAPQDKQKFVAYAVSELEKQHDAFPYDMRAKAFLAALYSAAGRPADTIRIINEALAVNNRRQQYYFVAAEAYLNSGEMEQAITTLRRAYELAPAYPEAIENLVTVLILSGKSNEAETVIQERYGKRMVGRERYAQAYFQMRQYEKSVEVWRLLVGNDPKSYQYHANLGVALAASGKSAEAIAEIEKAIELEPRFAEQGRQLIEDIKRRAQSN